MQSTGFVGMEQLQADRSLSIHAITATLASDMISIPIKTPLMKSGLNIVSQ
jgi:hypothetical protein